MKKLLSIVLYFGVLSVNAQVDYGVNWKLFWQVSKNQTVRITSENLIRKSYKDQKDMYKDISNNLTKAVAIHDMLYKNLKNVNSAIKQGKRLMLFKDYIVEISKNAHEMLKESNKNLKYSVLFSDLYLKVIEKSTELSVEVTSSILNENKDFLMDAYDREMLINKMFQKADELNGYILLITMRLKRANQIAFWKSVPILDMWVYQDKMVVNEIMDKYKYNF